MEKCFLTNGGSLLRFHPTQKFYFQKPNGEFIREVSDSEAEFLSQNCLEVDIHHSNEHPEFLPTWHFVKSILVVDDYSNYRAETSCNGGDYAFHTYHDWYVAKYPDGSWKFAFVENHSTSAEFSYTELGGNFDSNPGNCYITNVEGNMAYTMGCSSHDDVLEKIATMSSFENMWNEMYFYIPCKWDEEDEGYTHHALSFSDKKEIITRLKDIYESICSEKLKNDEVLKFEELHLHFKRSKSPRRGGKRGERR